MKKFLFSTKWLILAALIMGFVLPACGRDPSPVTVYVTPTPAREESPQPQQEPPEIAAAAALTNTITPVPAAALAPSATPTPTFPPGVSFGPIISDDELPPAATATSQSQPASPPPGVSYGPIVGPGHTLIPTETRLAPTFAPITAPTAGPSPTPGPGLRRDLMGIQVHPYIDNREFDLVLNYAKDLRVTWIKFQFNWSLLESSSGHYTELFYMLRLYVQRAHSAGFKVMISVAKAPGWSRTPDTDGIMREDGPPGDPQALADFLGGMLNQVGVDVYGAPYISAIEVWNEPNLQREWYGNTLTGTDYMRYFGPAYQAIRQFSAKVIIITAAPAPAGDSVWSTNDRTWLQQLYNAGLGQYGADVMVGVHPYAWANPPEARCCASPSRGWDDQPQFFLLDTLEDYHKIMLANGHGSSQLWATELGWATFDGLRNTSGQKPADPPDTPYFGFITQWQQADYTLRALYVTQSVPYMGPVILWNLNFATLGGALDKPDPQAAYGMLDGTWQPRPVYLALKQAP